VRIGPQCEPSLQKYDFTKSLLKPFDQGDLRKEKDLSRVSDIKSPRMLKRKNPVTYSFGRRIIAWV
jgi:hypothetical protein